MKLGKFLDAEKLITYIFSKFPGFEKGKVEHDLFMLNLNYIENIEVDDSSEVHDFISLATKNKVTKNSDSTENTKINKKVKNEKTLDLSLTNDNNNFFPNESIKKEIILEKSVDDFEYIKLKDKILKYDQTYYLKRDYN